jgi:hypothetical protein
VPSILWTTFRINTILKVDNFLIQSIDKFIGLGIEDAKLAIDVFGDDENRYLRYY